MTDILNNIKQLRERTGVGILECKKVLNETNGDIEKAVELLRKAGQAKAVKKSGRIAAEGVIGIKSVEQIAVILEMNSETDFTARDESFLKFVDVALDCVIDAKTGDLETLKNHVATNQTDSLEKQREALVAKIGENIHLRRVRVFQGSSNALITYSHGGKIGVVVEYKGDDKVCAKDIAMHIAAINPIALTQDDISAELIESEREIFLARAKEEGLPEDKIDMIVQNQVKKFVSQSALLGQPFVKDQNMKIEKLLKEKGVEIIAFARFEVGEGIEKKEENFAKEVAAQIKSR